MNHRKMGFILLSIVLISILVIHQVLAPTTSTPSPRDQLYPPDVISSNNVYNPLGWNGSLSIQSYLDAGDLAFLANVSASVPPVSGVERGPVFSLTGPLSNIETEEDLEWLTVTGGPLVNYGIVDVTGIDDSLLNVFGPRALLVEQALPNGDIGIVVPLPGQVVDGIKGKKIIPEATLAVLGGSANISMSVVAHVGSGGGGGCPLVRVSLPGGETRYYTITSPGIIFIDPREAGIVNISIIETGSSETTIYSLEAYTIRSRPTQVLGILVGGGDQPRVAVVDMEKAMTMDDPLLAPGGLSYPIFPGGSYNFTLKTPWNYILVSFNDPVNGYYYRNPGERISQNLTPSSVLPESSASIILKAGSNEVAYSLDTVTPLDGVYVVPVPKNLGRGPIEVELRNDGLVPLGLDFVGLAGSQAVQAVDPADADSLDVEVSHALPILLEGDKSVSFSVRGYEEGVIALFINASVQPIINDYYVVELPSIHVEAEEDAVYTVTLPTTAVLIPGAADSVSLVINIDGTDNSPVSVLVDHIVAYYKPFVVPLSNELWRCAICDTFPDTPLSNNQSSQCDMLATDTLQEMPAGCLDYCSGGYAVCSYAGVEANYTAFLAVSTYGASISMSYLPYQGVYYKVTVYLAVSYIVLSTGEIVIESTGDGQIPEFKLDPVVELALGVDVDDEVTPLVDEYSVSTMTDEGIQAVPYLPDNSSYSVLAMVANVLSVVSTVTGAAGLAAYGTPASVVLSAASTATGVSPMLISLLEVPDRSSGVGQHDFLTRRIFAYEDNGIVYDGVHNASVNAMVGFFKTLPASGGSADVSLNLTFYLPPGPSFFEDYSCTAYSSSPGYHCYCRYSSGLETFLLSIGVDVEVPG